MNEASVMSMIVLAGIFFLCYFIAKKTGRSFREVLLGKERRFGKSDGKENVSVSEKKENNGRRGKRKKEGNSTASDIRDFLSAMLTVSRQQHFYLIYPGMINHSGETSKLLMLLVTRQKIIGIRCLGYGGLLLPQPQSDDKMWLQRLDDTEKSIPSPEKGAEEDRKIAERALREIGLSEIPFTVCNVFTSPTVRFEGPIGENCFKTDEFLKYLEKNEYGKGELIPKEIGKKLIPLTKKQNETAQDS